MTIDFSSFDFETINEPAPEEQAYRDITPGKHGETILVQVHELYEHGDSGFGVQVKDAADPEATAYLNLFKRHMHVVSVNGQPMNQRALKLFEGLALRFLGLMLFLGLSILLLVVLMILTGLTLG